VLDPDAPIEDWAGAVRTLWNDNSQYDRLSSAAAEFSRRPAMDPARQFADLLGVLEHASQRRSLEVA
jgi:hypothetical protein